MKEKQRERNTRTNEVEEKLHFNNIREVPQFELYLVYRKSK